MPKNESVDVSRFTPSIHPSYMRLLSAHLHAQGFSYYEIFEESSLSWEALLERQRFVSLEQFSVVAQKGIALSNCPWLGLEISSIIQVSSHGPLGYGALAAKNVQEAFELVVKMLPTRLTLYSAEFETGPEYTGFRMFERVNAGELTEFFQVMLLGSFFDLLEKIVGSWPSGVRVFLPYPEPTWRDRYSKRFSQVELNFDAEEIVVEFPNALLKHPCLTADEFAYRNAARECQALLDKRTEGGDLADKIINDLVGMAGNFPTLEGMADRYHVSSRTLIRRLKSEDTKYQYLVDEVRKDLACWRLLNSKASIESIAEGLGFVDTSNFSRVFRRWFGCTPSEFRKI